MGDGGLSSSPALSDALYLSLLASSRSPPSLVFSLLYTIPWKSFTR